MKRLVVFALGTGLSLLLVSSAHATAIPSGQVIAGSTNGSGLSTAMRYIVNIAGVSGPQSGLDTTSTASTTVPLSGTFSSFYVKMNAAPGVGTSFTFSLRKNAATTSLACTISDTATTCNDIADTISVSPGDHLTISSLPSGVPTNTGAKWSFLFTPTTAYHTGIFGDGTSISNATGYVPPQGYASQSMFSVEASSTMPFPTGGTLSSMYTSLASALASTKSYAFTVRDGSVSSSVTCTATANNGCHDTVNNATISASDLVDLNIIPTNTPATLVMSQSYDFLPTNNGDFIFLAGHVGNDDTASPDFIPLSGNISGFQGTESSAESLVHAMNVKAINVALVIPPGSGQTKTFTLMKNGVATTLLCTISDSNTSCSATGSISFGDGDTASTKVVLSASAAKGDGKISYLAALPIPTAFQLWVLQPF